MVVRSWDGNRLLWRALAASLGLHLLLALFLPVWTAQVSGGLQPVESISFAHLTHVTIQRRAPASLPAAQPSTHRRAPTVSFDRTRAELTAKTQSPRVHPSAQAQPVGHARAAAPRPAVHHSAALYARPAATAAGTAVQQAPPAPTPAPATTVAPRPVAGNGASNRGGVLPFGATQDPVLDPSVQAQLASRFAVHVTLLVTVGEDGRTKRVVFQPPIDADTERAIEALLADASWDAAVCGGGVSCEGTATIKL